MLNIKKQDTFIRMKKVYWDGYINRYCATENIHISEVIGFIKHEIQNTFIAMKRVYWSGHINRYCAMEKCSYLKFGLFLRGLGVQKEHLLFPNTYSVQLTDGS